MSSTLKFIGGAMLLVGAFAAGRHLVPSAEAAPMPPAVLYGNEAPTSSENPLRDDAAISVGSKAPSKPVLAMITVLFGPRGKHAYYASGVVIADDVVATATHVLPETFDAAADHIFVDCDGRRISGTLLYHDRGREVMLVGASCGQAGVRVDTTPLEWDEPLMLTGFDFAFAGTGERRRLASATPFAKPTSFIPGANLGNDERRFEEPARRVFREIRDRHLPEPLAITGAMRRGNSGGPVYRKTTGDIVGLAIIIDAEYDRTFMVPAVTIHEALRQTKLLE